ncbi:MAG: TIGR03067 domain-containing protein [Pirellulales bacterium]
MSPSAIVGKWKLIETLSDLGNPKPLKYGGKGEIVEFTADGRQREPGARSSRSKAFGEVLYRLDTKKNPPHIDTSYAGGTALRTGIYRLEGDRLIICTTVAKMGRRPKKFAGFPARPSAATKVGGSAPKPPGFIA